MEGLSNSLKVRLGYFRREFQWGVVERTDGSSDGTQRNTQGPVAGLGRVQSCSRLQWFGSTDSPSSDGAASQALKYGELGVYLANFNHFYLIT